MRRGLSDLRLKTIGLVLVAVSALGTAVVAPGIAADLGAASVSQLTVAVLLEAVSWTALPIYAWLLYSGFAHTRSVARYGLRLAALAVVAEIPYDLATSGRVWDMSSQNPVFALLVSLIVVWALAWIRHRMPGRSALACVAIVVAGVLWPLLFNVGLRFGRYPGGVLIVLFSVIFSYLHRRENTMMAVGGALGAVALVFPAIGMAVLHYRNENPGMLRGRYLFYLAYPVCLLTIGLFGLIA